MKTLKALGLLAGALAVALPLAQSLPADEAAANHAYEMSVVIDRAYGELVSRGRYERAILRIAGHSSRFPFASATNLCVAHTMVGQYRHATRHCDKALEIAAEIAGAGLRKDRDATTEWALAFSNRGVLRARTGDADGAELDFRAAIELRGESQVPMHNLVHLGMERGEPRVVLD